jgi:tetratricopeptide (TPR) repeat protein
MIVRNEEANIGACLESARGLFAEIIVVDTGSTDRTKAIARSFGAKVVDFPWCDSFADARNAGLEHATGEWIFWLDADDRLAEEDREKLRTLFASLGDEPAAYVLKCVCLPDDSGVSTVVDHVRLFRNDPAVRWEHRVHEQVLPAVRRAGHDVRWADARVQHTGYQDASLRARKLQRDLRLLEMERKELGEHPFTLFNLGQVYRDLGRHQEALTFLRRSLELSQPADSIVRKLYSLIAGCHLRLGSAAEAVAACRQGLAVCPDDTELLFLLGGCWRSRGTSTAPRSASSACWRPRRRTTSPASPTGCAPGRPATTWPASAGPRAGTPRSPRTGRRLLEAAIAADPNAVWPRLILTHVLLQEGTDPEAAERALKAVLELEPGNAQARHNLALLRAQRRRLADDAFTGDQGLPRAPSP